MKPIKYFLSLFNDFYTLQDYGEKKNVDFEEIKRRSQKWVRDFDRNIPDHFYKAGSINYFSKMNSLTEFFLDNAKVLDSFLEFTTENKIYVREEKFVEWHNNVITYSSPLFLISLFIFYRKSEDIDFSESKITEFFNKYILPNTKYTALLRPRIKPVDSFFEEIGGFNDLHIHLNGTVETDSVFQDILSSPEKVLKEVKTDVVKKELEELGVRGIPLLDLAKKAKNLRDEMFGIIFEPNKSELASSSFEPIHSHPFSIFFNNEQKKDLSNENLKFDSLMIVLVLKKISETKNENLSKKLFEYLLINRVFSTLIVQTQQDFGFGQFQTITINKLREISDNKQLSKILQLSGNEKTYFSNIEFRISPSMTTDGNLKYMREIKNSWKNSLKEKGDDNSKKLGFIFHFIKKPEKIEKLQKEYDKKADILIGIKKNALENSDLIVGIDAASNEMDTPPGAFGNVYKKLRKNGFNHFTFHAGEDFYHIISGLRAIYEAIDFCDLQHGDRIGHATASGTSVKEWAEIVGNTIYEKKGEHLDDLIFMYFFIEERKIEELYGLLPILNTKILNNFQELYEETKNLDFIIEFWKHKYDSECNNKDILDFKSKINENEKKLNEFTEISVFEVLDENQIELFQKKILEFMHEKEIVIEANPTSNIRIGYHFSLKTYQLFNWWKWKKDGFAIPPVVLGSDDAGIFATNIFNEYALVYCYMVYEMNVERNDAMEFLREICTNAKTYLFS